jgi:hypothetical protein
LVLVVRVAPAPAIETPLSVGQVVLAGEPTEGALPLSISLLVVVVVVLTVTVARGWPADQVVVALVTPEWAVRELWTRAIRAASHTLGATLTAPAEVVERVRRGHQVRSLEMVEPG